MNSNMLFLMLALSSSSSSGSTSSSNLMETFLYTSNMLPEMPRMLLAMNSIKAQEDRRNREAEDLANRLAYQLHAAMTGSGTDVKFTKAQVDANTDLKALLDRLTDAKRAEIVGP